MDSWPACHNTRKNEETNSGGNEGTRNFPHLTVGEVGALSLVEKNNRLEWASISKRTTVRRLVTSGKYMEVFPPTRPPPLSTSQIPITRRSEQGANFLRTRFPDIDIASDLIRDQLTEDARFNKELETFDPQLGNTLGVVYFPEFSHMPAVLAFPMGELRRDLNLSPFTCSKEHGFVFRPAAAPAHSFLTPIQQVLSSNPVERFQALAGTTDQHLAVRTFGSTSVLQIRATEGASSSLPHIKVRELGRITASAVGNQPVADIDLSCSASMAGVVVNEIGEVYQYNVNSQRVFQLTRRRMTPSGSVDGPFWRLALAEHGQRCYLASEKQLRQVDFRMEDSCLDLLSLSDDVITAIERPRADHILRLVSTSEVLWIDERSPQKPLLGYKHGRQYDRSLGVLTADLPTPFTMLTSRRNGLVTVYDISPADDHLIHVNASPRCLPAVLGCNERHPGTALVRHPSLQDKALASLFRLCERGNIHCVSVYNSLYKDELSATLADRPNFIYSEAVRELEKQFAKLRADPGPLGGRNFAEVDASATYKKLSGTRTEEGDSAIISDVLDRIPTILHDGASESMVTMFDIAFRSDKLSPNADFLTPCAVNSNEGFRTLAEGRLSATPIIKQVPWSYDILPIIQQNDAGLSRSPNDTVENLRRYDLTCTDLNEESMRGMSEAREQLALDLDLSSTIFSLREFPNSANSTSEALEHMSRATEALSLDDGPSSIHFGYLRPIAEETKGKEETGPSFPAGVRELLKDWKIGADPAEPVSRIRREGIAQEYPWKRVVTSRTTRSQPILSRSRPVPNTSPAVLPDAHRTRSLGSSAIPSQHASQSPATNTEISGSQRITASTQILPGPHGGRVAQDKRKPTKKRVGGF